MHAAYSIQVDGPKKALRVSKPPPRRLPHARQPLRSAPRPPRCASREVGCCGGSGLVGSPSRAWAAASSAVPEPYRSRAGAAALKLEVLSGDAVEHVRARHLGCVVLGELGRVALVQPMLELWVWLHERLVEPSDLLRAGRGCVVLLLRYLLLAEQPR